MQEVIDEENTMKETTTTTDKSAARPNADLKPMRPGTVVQRPDRAASVQLMKPTDETIRLHCRRASGPLLWDGPIDAELWAQADEAAFNFQGDTGAAAGPRTFVRFLRQDQELWFYVEAECQPGQAEENDHETVWAGSNVEFLIAPRWHVEPFADEYEFLFNSDGGYADLHWTKGLTVEQALAWEAEGLEWRTLEQLTFHRNMQGWALVGRVPFKALGASSPGPGDYWGLGLFRKHVRADEVQLLAWSPPLTDPPKFHTPTRFGMLIFASSSGDE